MWIKFTPEYLSGIVVGCGVGLFIGVMLIEFNFSSATTRLMGLAMMILGGFWKFRIQKSV